jgi:dihydroflavonol-4-reductase
VRGNGTRRVLEQRRINVEGTARLYRAAHDHGLERIVHVSSMSTLGAEREPRARDEQQACNVRHLDLSYVETKLESEERARSAAWAGMPVVIVNPAWLVGPRLDGRVGTIASGARAKKRFIQAGGISMADVDDVSRGILAALDRGRTGERYLLGGHNLTWLEVHALLARELELDEPTTVMPVWTSRMLEGAARIARLTHLTRTKWPPEEFRVHGWYLRADSSKAERELGYAIRPVDEMVRRMLGVAA